MTVLGTITMAERFQARLLRGLWTSGKFCCASSIRCGLSVRGFVIHAGCGQAGNRHFGAPVVRCPGLAGMKRSAKRPGAGRGVFTCRKPFQNSSSLTFSTASRARSAGARRVPSASPASSGRLCWLFRPSSSWAAGILRSNTRAGRAGRRQLFQRCRPASGSSISVALARACCM